MTHSISDHRPEDATAARASAIKDALKDVSGSKRPQVTERLKAVPRIRQLQYLRSVNKTTAPRLAIKAFCYECLGYEGDLDSCTSKACPLFEYKR